VKIRSYLKRRWTGTFVGCVTILFTVGLARTHLEPPVAWGLFALGIASVAVLVANLYRTPCPNCSRPHGSTVFWINTGAVYDIFRCPHCDISLDKQMPGRS
jgi:hypothetical protein